MRVESVCAAPPPFHHERLLGRALSGTLFDSNTASADGGGLDVYVSSWQMPVMVCSLTSCKP